MLEADRLKLMRQLRDNAAQIGEKGIRFWGLSAGQLMKVTEFATNLRDGITDLPLDDKSLELSAKVKTLEMQVSTDKLTIERLEREISGLDGNYAANSGGSPGESGQKRNGKHYQYKYLCNSPPFHPPPHTELFAMKEMLENLQKDNRSLTETISKISTEGGGFRPFNADSAATSLTPQIRKQAEMVIQEPLVDMPQPAQMQFSKLVEAHASLTEDIMDLRKELKDAKKAAHSSEDVARLSQEVAKMINLAGGVPAQQQQQTPGGIGGALQTPNTVSFGNTVKFPMKTPNTPGGQAMLSKQLNALSLPPEEWAEEVRELNGQLIECLEQLSDREKELEEHEELLRRYEGHLGSMRQQSALLYKEHMESVEKSVDSEKRLNRQIDELRGEREALTLRVTRYQELAALEEKESSNPSSVHKALRDLTRRVTVHEVNEQTLARKYGSLESQLKVEAEARVRAENSLVEIEVSSRKRILYLEQWKSYSVELTERLQRQLAKSVPDSEHNKVLRELEMIREDYLDLLHKEADVRLRLTEQKDLPRKLKRYQHKADELEIQLVKAQADAKAAGEELEHQKMLTNMAGSNGSNGDINVLVAEAARFRGEAARFELEFKSADATVKKLTQRVVEFSTENDSLRERLRVSDSHERHGRSLAEAARRRCLEIENKYEKGLSHSEASELLEKQEFLMAQLEKSERDVEKYKELADLASSQASALEAIKSDHAEQLLEMQNKCGDIESKTDDDAIIGRLQRQLLVAKQGYKDSMRKIENLRSTVRKKEAMSRLFEHRLDKREEALHKAREEARIQISSLRDALRDLAFNGGDATAALQFIQVKSEARKQGAEVGTTSILEKAKQLSTKVSEMSKQSESREEELNNSEDMRRRLENQVAELIVERESADQLVADLQEASAQDTKSSVVAKRLIAISEEVRTNKLAALQARRQVATLKDEKRNLETTLARCEDTIEALEESKAELETRNLLSQGEGGEGSGATMDAKDLVNASTPGDVKLLMQMTPAGKEGLKVTPPGGLGTAGPVTLDDEDTLGVAEEFDDARARKIRADLDKYRQEVADLKEQQKIAEETKEMYAARCDALSKDVEHYKVMSMTGGASPNVEGTPASSSGGGGVMTRDQLKMQEAAHQTISSLKQLVTEKNRIIEKYKRQIKQNKELARRATAADRKEVEKLTDKIYSENEDAIGKLRNAVKMMERGGEGSISNGPGYKGDMKGGLVEQVEQAALLIAEKDDAIQKLELKLRTAEGARERAESRCGGALEEMDRQRADMITLAAQLQESEERVLEAMEDRSAAKKISELQSQLRSKETKMATLRQAVVKLKQAFIESEEARAAGDIAARHSRHEALGNDKEALKDEIHDMRSQLSSLIEEMAGAKSALSSAKSSKEKSDRALTKVRGENEKLEERIDELEDEIRKANEATDDAVRVKEEAMGKMRKMGSKMKDMKGESAKGDGEEKAELADLKKRIMVLTSQNLALRSAAAGQRLRKEKAEEEKDDESNGKGRVKEVSRPSSSGTGSRFSGADEKKLQRRIEILERRLEEKSSELETALGSADQARKLLDRANKEKDFAQKQKEKSDREIKNVKSSGMGDLSSLEETREKLFQLEEDLVRARRQAELEMPRTISGLKAELGEALEDRRDAESTLKATLERYRGGKDGLRESESLYMREEQLREEVAVLKKARRDLESKLLQRDSEMMEAKFDLEQAQLDKGRQTRRITELTQSVQAAKRLSRGNGGGGGGGGEREVGGRFKRERDLEGVVDALKRVVEKLKGENERLRRGAADSVRNAESDRRAKDAQRKAQELSEENKSLRTRALAGDEAVQRLAQRGETLNQMRRQLKARDDELRTLTRKLEEADRSKTMMVDEMEHANKRTNSLERELLSARREVGESGGRRMGEEESRREMERLEREIEEQKSVIRTLRESSRAGGGSGGKETYALRQQIGDLKAQLQGVERDKQRLERRVASGGGGGGGTSSREGSLLGEVKKLREENKGLQKELSAFDLDFFEEIEDLKYKYNRAQQKLRDAGLR